MLKLNHETGSITLVTMVRPKRPGASDLWGPTPGA